jgi:hypothetical protein
VSAAIPAIYGEVVVVVQQQLDKAFHFLPLVELAALEEKSQSADPLSIMQVAVAGACMTALAAAHLAG